MELKPLLSNILLYAVIGHNGNSYRSSLRRYYDALKRLPFHLPSEHKLERFLTVLVNKVVATSTLNQALNAIIFFDKDALSTDLKNVQALRAKRSITTAYESAHNSPATVLVPVNLCLQILQRHVGWGWGPDSANSSRLHSAPFQCRQ